MKKKDLIERLEALGAEEGRHGGNHDIWPSSRRIVAFMPRVARRSNDLGTVSTKDLVKL